LAVRCTGRPPRMQAGIPSIFDQATAAQISNKFDDSITWRMRV
jgi:hypothetical protein